MALTALARSVPDTVKGEARQIVTGLQSKLGEKAKLARDLANELAESNDTLGRMFAALPKVVGKNAATVALAASAYGAGYVKGYLLKSKSEKIGPLDAVATIGTAIAVGSATFINNPDLAEVGLQLGRGMLAGELYQMGLAKFEKDQAKKAAGGAPAAAEAAKK